MRTFIIFILILAAVFGGIAVYLSMTTPDDAQPMRFPLNAAQRALLERVPESSDAFALIPTAAVLHRKLLENPITRDAVEQWTATQPVPPPWIIGAADVVAWRNGKNTSYAIRMDPFRALLVRVWMMLSSDVQAYWDGSAFVFNGAGGAPIERASLDEIVALTNGLAEGDMLVVQRDRQRGAFPPLARPAVTSARVLPRDIILVSRARSSDNPVAAPLRAQFPSGAVLTASFAEAPRLLGELQRLTGVNAAAFARNGGTIALYDIKTGTLLPRPEGVIVVPANAETRDMMRRFANIASLVGEVRDTGREIIVAFDRESASTYIEDAPVPASWPANRWTARVDVQRILPILEGLGKSRGLEFAAGRLHRAANDLRRWTAALEKASTLEASDSVRGGVEELRVRIASK